jgi:hypothetical protein
METIRKIKHGVTRFETRRTGVQDQYGNKEREHREVTVEGEIVLEVDVQKLLLVLGAKALRSKGAKAQECNGMVRVVARNRNDIRATDWSK